MLRNKISLKYILAATIMWFMCFGAKAQTQGSTVYYDDDSAFFVTPAPADVLQGALETILPNYNDWTTAQLNGTLKLKGLPVTPSVKIYMEKGKCISISVRASFLGEVGRIEVDGDSLLAVNKMKRTYCTVDFSSLKYDYPNIVGDVQSLLLDRIVIPKAGELSTGNADFVDFNLGGSEEVEWIVDFPKGLSSSSEMGMRYAINSQGLISQLVGFMLTPEHENVLCLGYDYRSGGYDMSISFIKDEKPQFSTVVNFDPVQWEANKPASIQLNSKFKQLGFKDFIRSFKF